MANKSKPVKLISEDVLEHFGIPGMRWGVRRERTPAATTRRGKPVAKTKSFRGKQIPVDRRGRPLKNMSVDDANRIVFEKHSARAKKLQKEGVDKLSFSEKVAKAYGLKKNSKGQWVAKPEAYMKAAATGVALGFASFFVEMKLRDFVAGQDVYNAAYTQWLRSG